MGADPGYAEAMAELGRGLAARNWRLVYGGGDVGLMGVVARHALASGGEVLGIIPHRLLEREVGKRDVTELLVTETMFDRKRHMIAQSDAFLVLPGGFGTLDELLEVLTLKQLGYIAAPILIVDQGGIWSPLLRAFEAIVQTGFAEPGALELYEAVPDVERALRRLEAAAAAN
jgi:uncharacterized protein (TIGR00730 family)